MENLLLFFFLRVPTKRNNIFLDFFDSLSFTKELLIIYHFFSSHDKYVYICDNFQRWYDDIYFSSTITHVCFTPPIMTFFYFLFYLTLNFEVFFLFCKTGKKWAWNCKSFKSNFMVIQCTCCLSFVFQNNVGYLNEICISD